MIKSRIGCLIIHGFDGTTLDVEPLSKYLQSKGFVTFCPSLKCSMENRRVFPNANYKDWLESAELGLYYLKSRCKDVVIIGLYMGALIALNFATRFKNIGVVTINAPIYHWDVKNMYYNILLDFKRKNFTNVKRYVKLSTKISIPELINFKLLIGKTKHILEMVKTPVFIAQGLKDDTVNYKSAEYIYKKVSSNIKVLKYYEKINPDLFVYTDNNLLFEDVEKFIKQIIKRENGVSNKFLPNYTYLDRIYNSLLKDVSW